jgi:hypothetical protein
MSKINKWEIQLVKFSDVKPNPENPRAIDEVSLIGLRKSLERFGYVEPIIWNKRTGHIVGGHQRFLVLTRANVSEAQMVVVDMSPEEELVANITLNNPEIEGDWSDEIVDLLHQVETNDTELFSSLNLDNLRTSLEGGHRDVYPEPEKEIKDGEGDTECPCCHFRWNIRPEDVEVEET